MLKNIREREAQGIEQKDTWEALKSLIHNDSEYKRQNIKASSVDLYRKLLVEANA